MNMMIKMFFSIAPLLLFLAIEANAQRNPSISFISKDKVVNIGDTLELKCQVQDAATYPVSWTILGKSGKDPIFISRGQAIIVPGDRHQLFYEERDSTYTLVVNKVQEIDAGTYRCEITTSVSGNVSLLNVNFTILTITLIVYSIAPMYPFMFAFHQSLQTILHVR